MGTLLPWQPENCAITQLFKRILSSYLAHMFYWIKDITGLPGCYGSAVTKATFQQIIERKYFKPIFGNLFFVTIHMTDLAGCYGSTVTRLETRKSIITDHT